MGKGAKKSGKKDPEKLKKLIEKKDKVRTSKSTSVLKINAKGVRNKEQRKDIVRRQKLELKKLKKLQKLKEKHIRATQGEEVIDIKYIRQCLRKYQGQ